ncbi:hypothetical protein FRACA_510020 [Frankia canadensis]|uniref:Uncharacterized protein n=1 Tax=Frankia canadensis TaxID=1836972 RepID=A0A2I2KYI7_9ACTN|nr:hypothetical protein FRACA_510020 [Frankia canadensis]SOU58010.1 hypothetical protein FRACA_510020 [Frankia canadensis]
MAAAWRQPVIWDMTLQEQARRVRAEIADRLGDVARTRCGPGTDRSGDAIDGKETLGAQASGAGARSARPPRAIPAAAPAIGRRDGSGRDERPGGRPVT